MSGRPLEPRRPGGSDAATPTPATPAATISFGPFSLDRLSGRLLRHRQAIPLRPKTWAVLSYLAERPGVLVAGEELLDAVWPDVSVTPDTLSKSIGELRRALGDDAKVPRFIETVHRRGFRFLAGDGAPPLPADGGSDGVLLAGRDGELRQLAESLDRARSGRRQTVIVSGPAGIGKTAVVEAFLHGLSTAEADGLRIARGANIEHHGPREPYLPFLEALDRIARGADAERVLDLLRRNAPMWLAQVPWLITGSDAEALRQSLLTATSERMLREFCAFAEAYAAETTLVLVLEDLHWTDPASVDLITMLAHRPEPARLLLIGTYRPADAAAVDHVVRSAVRELEAHRLCRDVLLHDLSQEAVQGYLETRFAGSEFPAALARALHRHTDGHPLFVVAVVDHLLLRGRIVETDPGWALSVPVEQIDLGVPDDIWRTIVDQFERLTPSDRRLLETASVVGTQFAPQLVAAVLGLGVGDTELRCDELARTQRFLRAAGRADWPDGSVARQYAFTHDLYRQVVYDVIPDRRRAELHQRIGEVLETAYADQATEIAVSLALHFERSRDVRRAVRFLAAAAARARRRFAGREALELLRAALALLQQLSTSRERTCQELELRLALGSVLSDVHGFASEPVRENIEHASALVAEAGGEAQRFDVLYSRWYLHAIRAEREETLADVEALAEVARRLGTAESRSILSTVRLRTAVFDGRFSEAQRLMDELGAAPVPAGGQAAALPYGVDPWLAGATHYAMALCFLGQVDEARRCVRTNLTRARGVGQPVTLAAVLAQSAIAMLLCRDAAEAAELSEQALTVCNEVGLPFWRAAAGAVSGWARAQQGQAAEGSEAILSALEALRATGASLFVTCVLAFLGESYLASGRRADGLKAVEEGLELCATKLDCGYEPELWRLKGELMLVPLESERPSKRTDRHWSQAESCFLRAIDLSREAGARSDELRAALSLGRHWQAGGRAVEARELVAGACVWFGARTRRM